MCIMFMKEIWCFVGKIYANLTLNHWYLMNCSTNYLNYCRCQRSCYCWRWVDFLHLHLHVICRLQKARSFSNKFEWVQGIYDELSGRLDQISSQLVPDSKIMSGKPTNCRSVPATSTFPSVTSNFCETERKFHRFTYVLLHALIKNSM